MLTHPGRQPCRLRDDDADDDGELVREAELGALRGRRGECGEAQWHGER